MLKKIGVRISKYIKLYILKKEWRRKNKHNFTNLNNIFPINIVKVGKNSYGNLNVYSWGSENEELEIGNFVSIAEDVKFILGGNHQLNTFTTYPFKVMMFGEKVEALTKGKIIVKDDVWIGMSVLILSGIIIEQGAVIAAGSVVTKDIPPYAIVGGNPAKILKYRFSKEIIEKVKNVDLTKIKLEENKENLYEKLTEKNIKNLLEEINENIIKDNK